jgi:hypothetical protein
MCLLELTLGRHLALGWIIRVKLIQNDKFEPVRFRNDSAIKRILARHRQFKAARGEAVSLLPKLLPNS